MIIDDVLPPHSCCQRCTGDCHQCCVSCRRQNISSSFSLNNLHHPLHTWTFGSDTSCLDAENTNTCCKYCSSFHIGQHCTFWSDWLGMKERERERWGWGGGGGKEGEEEREREEERGREGERERERQRVRERQTDRQETKRFWQKDRDWQKKTENVGHNPVYVHDLNQHTTDKMTCSFLYLAQTPSALYKLAQILPCYLVLKQEMNQNVRHQQWVWSNSKFSRSIPPYCMGHSLGTQNFAMKKNHGLTKRLWTFSFRGQSRLNLFCRKEFSYFSWQLIFFSLLLVCYMV